ncbi:potassium channel tetramerization domain-containing protein [Cyclospora cayetanensis]|uniref:Potassium channel tetramerization domain-containing protein n=1 Tax=Cyclospora cayetanensis TaxID=88456 RepID=A0A1D3CV94_9EIME|nr:potassium channel tetramerization domain-containing protein [Cyclospora cayetanensis]
MAESIASRCAEAERQATPTLSRLVYSPHLTLQLFAFPLYSFLVYLAILHFVQPVSHLLVGIPCSAVPARHSYTSPRLRVPVALEVGRSRESPVASALFDTAVMQHHYQNLCHQAQPVQEQQPSMLQELQHIHLSSSATTNSQGRRDSRSSNGTNCSQSSICRSDIDGCVNPRESLMMPQSTAVATTAVDAPPEQVKLVPTATAAELAARAEFLRRSLINDDPEPPEQTAVQDLGERVLYTDEEF